MAPALNDTEGLRALIGTDSISERAGQIVVSPRTTEELAAIARFANINKLAIEISGAGTKRPWGNPTRAELVVKTTGLAGVRHHSWHDLTATVGAGTPWATMQRALAVHNQQVALDALWPETATVGGIVATNDSGALRLRYGSLRDLIIGMTIVLADGTIAKSGGKVVKNVAGYDLHKLMTGAYGTLGVIAEVTFRLHPVEEHVETWSIATSDVDTLGQLMMRVLDSSMQVNAMQLRRTAQSFCLDVRLFGGLDCLADQRSQLHAMAADISSPEEDVWRARERVMDHAVEFDWLALKAGMLPANIPSVAKRVFCMSPSSTFVVQSCGLMTAALAADERFLSHDLTDLRQELEAAGGSLTVHRFPKVMVGKMDPWGQVGSALPLMREIKHRFDPNGILNPGRFVGGI
jgi:glycolate oxidase FAD binding subunit